MTLPFAVDFMRFEAIDRHVSELLSSYADFCAKAITPPIDVEDIAERFLNLDYGVERIASELGLPGLLGASWFEDGKIRVDESVESHEGRLAFTVAHEIGHWVMHRPQWQRFDKGSNEYEGMAIMCRSADSHTSCEWQANTFAARLLMPYRPFCTAADTIFQGYAVLTNYEDQMFWYADKVRDAGNFTNVGHEAVLRRLIDTRYIRLPDDSKPQLQPREASTHG